MLAFATLIWFVPESGDGENAAVLGADFDASALADAAPTTTVPAALVTGISDPDPGGDEARAEEPPADAEPTLADTTTTASTTSTSTSTTIPDTTTTSTTSSTAALVDVPEAEEVPEAIASATPAPLSLGEQALQRVSYPWRSQFPDWELVWRGPRNGIRALTFPQDKRVEVYIRSSDTAASLHRVFAHELGHVIDVELNSTEDRDQWVAQRGINEAAPWWPSAESPDFATGAGDFAEAFAVWETGVTTRSTVADQPSAADLALLRELSEG